MHGLTGHFEKTWTAPNSTNCWLKELLPDKVPDARILTFGYDAQVVNWSSVVSQNRIGNHGMNLLHAVVQLRGLDGTVSSKSVKEMQNY